MAKSLFSSVRQAGLYKDFGGATDSNEYKTNEKPKDKKHWADNEGQDCYAIYARGLTIDNSHIREYWQWTTDTYLRILRKTYLRIFYRIVHLAYTAGLIRVFNI